jgi:hypothetical protein
MGEGGRYGSQYDTFYWESPAGSDKKPRAAGICRTRATPL